MFNTETQINNLKNVNGGKGQEFNGCNIQLQKNYLEFLTSVFQGYNIHTEYWCWFISFLAKILISVSMLIFCLILFFADFPSQQGSEVRWLNFGIGIFGINIVFLIIGNFAIKKIKARNGNGTRTKNENEIDGTNDGTI